MSAGRAPRQRKEPVSEPRTPLFEVRDKVLPRPPQPIETILGDVGDLPDSGRRTARRALPDLRTAESEFIPTIAPADQAPRTARPTVPESLPAPQAATRPARSEARHSYVPRPELDRPTRDRLPSYESYPHWEAPMALARGRPLVLLLLAALVCGPVIWMFLQSPKTFISSYGGAGWSEAAGAAANRAFGAINVAAGEHSVLGAPSINAAAIDVILSKYGSPAAGTGQAWVKLGQQYGIDPAYAVAFFIHESSAGTNPGWAGMKPDGSTTHNVGNIICAGYATCYGRFRDYASWDEGIADWYKLISNEYVSGRGAASVEQIIPIYAPSSDNNDVPGYINVIVSMVDSWHQGVLR
jgi:hypothetical protein